MSSIKIYLNDGSLTDLSNFQKQYDISENQIGNHFSLDENIFVENLSAYGTIYWCEPLIRLLDAFREYKGEPVYLTSLFRSKDKQQNLIDRGLTDATISPHNMSFAADVNFNTDTEVVTAVDIFKKLSKQLSIPVRIGYKSYLQRGDTFIHIDVCNFYYGENGPWASHTYLPRSFSDNKIPYAWTVSKVEW